MDPASTTLAAASSPDQGVQDARQREFPLYRSLSCSGPACFDLVLAVGRLSKLTYLPALSPLYAICCSFSRTFSAPAFLCLLPLALCGRHQIRGLPHGLTRARLLEIFNNQGIPAKTARILTWDRSDGRRISRGYGWVTLSNPKEDMERTLEVMDRFVVDGVRACDASS